MTSLNGTIQGIGNGVNRIVKKTGTTIKLSVYDNLDRVIVFNEAGETSQTTLTGKNLFNKNDSNLILSGYVDENSYVTYPDCRTICIPVEPNTTYTVSKVRTMNFRIATTSVYPTNGSPVNRYLHNDSATSLTLTTGSTDSYLLAYIYYSGGDTLTPTEIIATVQIEKSNQATPYEEYCGGVPSPNPDYPQDIVGIGTRQLDGTYSVSIDYDDGDERTGTITASGLAYPLYEGDVLDFVNGKVIRANGCVDLGSLTFIKDTYDTQTHFYIVHFDGDNAKYWGQDFCTSYICGNYSYSNLPDLHLTVGNSQGNVILRIRDDSKSTFTPSDFKTAMDGVMLVYELLNPIDEYITLTGDISDIGTATVTADGTLTVKYDKVEMAIRKYSSPPDWSKIGYSATPKIILDGFEYSKRIYDSWTSAASYSSAYRGDKELKFFPEVDITGATNYSAMFQESGLLSTPSLTIGDGSNTVINSSWMFKSSPIEEIELTTSDPDQKVQITEIFNGCSNLKKATLDFSASGSMQYAFADCTRLERIEDGLDTSDVTSISEAFRACSSLVYLYELDLSSCTTCYRAFQDCTSLEHAPYINSINTGGNFQQMFWRCSSLKTLPPYNLHTPSNLTNMFQGTGSNLDENSRRNILSMLAACTYSGTKTLAHLGFTSSMYSAASWEALPNYSTFTAAGWSIGYS